MINLNNWQEGNRKRPSRVKKVILVLLITMSLSGGAFYFWYFSVFKHEAHFSGDKVRIVINAPEEVTAGSSYEYSIECQNNEKVDLNDARLTFSLPSGFSLVDALPSPLSKGESMEANVMQNIKNDAEAQTWQLGAIKQGTTSVVKIRGIILGAPGEKLVLKANLDYKPLNLGSLFAQMNEATVLIKNPSIEFNLEVPRKINQGGEVNIVLKYRNATSEDLENLRLQINYPEGFEFLSSNLRADQDNRIWDFRVLHKGDRERIDIKGKMNKIGEKKDYFFQAELGILDQYKQFFSLATGSADLTLLNPVLEITANLNQKEKLNVKPGDDLDFTFSYENKGDVPLENCSIVYEMKTDFLDQSSIQIEGGHLDGNSFIWDSAQNIKLLKLNPNDKGNVKMRARMLQIFPQTSLDLRELKISGKARLLSHKIEGVEGLEYTVQSNEIEAKIKSDLVLASEARYSTLDYKENGLGPLPPAVGQKTVYRIYWTLSNTTNDVDNVRLETVLPDNVEWQNDSFTSVGNSLKYNSETRNVIWEVGRLPAYSGSLLPGAQAYFKVGLTPRIDQAGDFAYLTNKILVFGRDLFCEEDIQDEHPSLDTELRNDSSAVGKGKVMAGK